MSEYILYVNLQEKLYKELMEVALKKQSEILQIIVGAIASERSNVLQLASDFQFDGILHYTFMPCTLRRALSIVSHIFAYSIHTSESQNCKLEKVQKLLQIFLSAVGIILPSVCLSVMLCTVAE